MMTTLTRLERLEAQVILPSSCPACAASERHVAAVREIYQRHGEPEGEPFAYVSHCAWCGRTDARTAVASGDGLIFLRMFFEALEAGRLCAPEVKAAWRELRARREDTALARELAEAQRVYEAELSKLPPPMFGYVCAVEGCGCASPKRGTRAA
jgi:hypothetical protein